MAFQPQILAMSCGGFLVEWGHSQVDAYLLSLVSRATPRVGFLPTAGGDSSESIAKFYTTFSPEVCKPSHLSLFHRDGRDLRAWALGQDIIYVAGGNTANLLALLRLHDMDRILREAWERGVVLTGVSAGMMCWYEAGLTDSFGGLTPMHNGLGFLSGSCCPHADSNPGRLPAFKACIAEGFPEGIAADDSVALHYIGPKLHRTLRRGPSGRAIQFRRDNGRLIETDLEVVELAVC